MPSYLLAAISAVPIRSLGPILVALIIVVVGDRVLIIGRLRMRHRDFWESIGSPTAFGAESKPHSLIKFIGNRDGVRKLDDGILDALVYIDRFSVVAVLIIFAGIAVLTLLGQK